MRITFVLPNGNLSGGTRVVAIYADRLKRRGHSVVVVLTPPRRPTLVGKVKSLMRGRGWPRRLADVPSHLKSVDVEHRVIDQARALNDADVPDADVVVATWWETAEWVANLSSTKGAKVHLIQGDDRLNYPKQDFFTSRRIEKTWVLPMHRIAVSRWLIGILPQFSRVGSPSCVPNGVDRRQFNAEPRSKQTVPTVGLVYTTFRLKGCDISLKAFELAARDIPGLRVVAFGCGKADEAVPLPLGAEYSQNPPQDSIRHIYAKCDAWLFGSRYEGFGLPILEAMACRTPVIATPAGAAPELLAGGGGVLVEAEDPVAMARAIVGICQMSDESWRTMSDRAYRTATNYTWDDATDLFEAALRTAIERNRRGELVLQPGLTREGL